MMHNQEDILISVRAKYVHKMLTGEKTVELRRRTLRVSPGTRVWIYTTAPRCVVEAFAFIDRVVTAPPKHLWQKYKRSSGVAQNEFIEYFSNVDIGCALILRDLTRLGTDVRLVDLRKTDGRFQPPQFYVRLSPKNAALRLLKRSTH